MFNRALLFPVEDPGHMLADGASGVGVELGEGVPVLCLEAVQDCLEDGIGVIGADPLGVAHRVDDTPPRVLQDAADVPQGLLRRVVAALSFAFLGCGRYAVGVPFLELVAAGVEDRTEVGVPVSCLQAEAGSDPRGHLGVTWGVYLCAGKPPLADIILSHPPDLTRCDSVIGLAIPAMSGHIQYQGTASGDLYIGISGINRVLLS